MEKEPRFIVAEAVKNFNQGKEANPSTLADRFAEALNKMPKGYRLHSFQTHAVVVGSNLQEKIIAVFEKE